METKKPTGSDMAIKAVNAVFGTAHFIFQSLADATASSEGYIVEKISHGEITRAQSMEHRRNATKVKQMDIKSAMERMKVKPAPKTT